MQRNILWIVIALIAASASQVQAQCQGGGGGGGASSGGAVTSGGSSGGTMLTSPGSWAYDQMLGQALQRQLVMARYQKAMEDQARRVESLARRQYWANVRREQKLKQAPANSPGQITARAPTSSTFASLEFSPRAR
ncbi:hypothetical protein NA78x_004645 [Anatilimnocola sp. NA78]|uniref:hypothetical protein n=1 Tax=Anatilimnocola sp. NA78 TaxID=3415683 RepID=UPI003CE499A9